MSDFRFNVLWRYRDELIQGLGVTLEVVLIALVLSWLLGIVFGSMRLSANRVVFGAATAYVEFFRIIPEIVIIFWIYYALPVLLDLQLSSLISGLLALTFIGSAFAAEIFRAGFQAVPRQHILAARGLGMSRFQCFYRIVLPQAIRFMIPPLVSHFVDMLKVSALLSTIAVTELMYTAGALNSRTFRPIEFFTVVAIAYFMIALPASLASRRLEHAAPGHRARRFGL